jgi:hypothetical protein
MRTAATNAAAKQFILQDLSHPLSPFIRWLPVRSGVKQRRNGSMDPRTKSAIDAVRVFGSFAVVNFSGPNFGSVVARESYWFYFRLADLRWGLC